MATVYSADEIIDKTLYMAAGKSINLRSLPSITSNLIMNVKGGELVGVVYSYVTNAAGLWWMIKRDNKTLWCLHYEGAFDIQNLSAQGALTPAEIQARKDEANKSFGEQTVDKIMSLAKIGIFAFAGVLLLKSFIRK
ncbi:MAG: hypothetical protein WCO13_00680 [Bacteroidota bacterium]